jgi:hypothetical protein
MAPKPCSPTIAAQKPFGNRRADPPSLFDTCEAPVPVRSLKKMACCRILEGVAGNAQEVAPLRQKTESSNTGDGCRTPMPSSDDPERGGFTTGTPWLPIWHEHLELCVERQKNDPACRETVQRLSRELVVEVFEL